MFSSSSPGHQKMLPRVNYFRVGSIFAEEQTSTFLAEPNNLFHPTIIAGAADFVESTTSSPRRTEEDEVDVPRPHHVVHPDDVDHINAMNDEPVDKNAHRHGGSGKSTPTPRKGAAEDLILDEGTGDHVDPQHDFFEEDTRLSSDLSYQPTPAVSSSGTGTPAESVLSADNRLTSPYTCTCCAVSRHYVALGTESGHLLLLSTRTSSEESSSGRHAAGSVGPPLNGTRRTTLQGKSSMGGNNINDVLSSTGAPGASTFYRGEDAGPPRPLGGAATTRSPSPEAAAAPPTAHRQHTSSTASTAATESRGSSSSATSSGAPSSSTRRRRGPHGQGEKGLWRTTSTAMNSTTHNIVFATRVFGKPIAAVSISEVFVLVAAEFSVKAFNVAGNGGGQQSGDFGTPAWSPAGFGEKILSVSLDPLWTQPLPRFLLGTEGGKFIVAKQHSVRKPTIDIVHQNEGPVRQVKWGPNKIAAWSNDLGVKLYHTRTQQKVSYIPLGGATVRAAPATGAVNNGGRSTMGSDEVVLGGGNGSSSGSSRRRSARATKREDHGGVVSVNSSSTHEEDNVVQPFDPARVVITWLDMQTLGIANTGEIKIAKVRDQVTAQGAVKHYCEVVSNVLMPGTQTIVGLAMVGVGRFASGKDIFFVGRLFVGYGRSYNYN